MDPKFRIKLDGISEDSVKIRFYSENKVVLTITQARVRHQSSRNEDLPFSYFKVYLDNSFKVHSFINFKYPIKLYTELSIIVKDRTNKEQFTVHIPLNGEDVTYNKMIYEGI